MTTAPPILFRWQGDGFTPLTPRAAAACDEHYVVGQVYRLVEQQDRSQASHNHYFAAITEAWRNLPDAVAEQFPTAEHLRKFALIKAGYADSRQIVASSKAEAVRLAAFIRPLDEYGIVTVSDAVVTHWTARSQNMRAMGKKDFEASKQAVLDLVAGMIGVTRDQLSANAGQAA